MQEVNLTSVYLCCKAALPYMQRQRRGSIVNTASFVAVMGAATSQISYTASKGGVLAMSRELGVQFAREGIRVNALCPGPVNTPLLQELFAKDPERAARRLVHIPAGRFAEAEEIAAAVAFLASDDAPSSTPRSSWSTAASRARTSRRCSRVRPGGPLSAPSGRACLEERTALAAVRRDRLRDALALDQVQRVEPLAQLARLGVPEPHPVADQQVVGGRAEQRGLHLARALLLVVAQALRQVRHGRPVGAAWVRMRGSRRRGR